MNLWLTHPLKMLRFKFWQWMASAHMVFVDTPEFGFDDEDE